jgi:hypothetical protein
MAQLAASSIAGSHSATIQVVCSVIEMAHRTTPGSLTHIVVACCFGAAGGRETKYNNIVTVMDRQQNIMRTVGKGVTVTSCRHSLLQDCASNFRHHHHHHHHPLPLPLTLLRGRYCPPSFTSSFTRRPKRRRCEANQASRAAVRFRRQV